MKKKRLFLLMLIVIVFAFLFIGCGSEIKGVPDDIVYMEFGEEFESLCSETYNSSYTIRHDVNKQSHIDTVMVEVVSDSEFCSMIESKCFRYQYDRDSDLWSLIDKGEWDGQYDFKKERIIGEWSSKDGTQCLTIHDIDVERGTIVISYYDEYEYNDPDPLYEERELKWHYNPEYYVGYGCVWAKDPLFINIYHNVIYSDLLEEYLVKIS